MWERFTERGRRVFVSAQEAARTLNHNYIDTEHILLGLIRVGSGIASQALENLGLTSERVEAEVIRVIGKGEATSSGQLPLTPQTKRVHDWAERITLQSRRNYVTPEDILLALLDECENHPSSSEAMRGGNVAAAALLNLEVDPKQIRHEYLRLASKSEQDRHWRKVRGQLRCSLAEVEAKLEELKGDGSVDLEKLRITEGHAERLRKSADRARLL